jgi:hypothetical protein
MNKEKIVIIILSLIILVGIGIFSYNKIIDVAYQIGVEDANLFINNQMINSLNQNGYVPFSFTQDGQIYQIKLGVIETNQQ